MILQAILGILVIALAVCLGYLARLRYIRYKFSHIPCPEPCHWLYGHLPAVEAKETNVHEIYIEWGKKYGKVFVTHFLDKVVVCAWGPENAKKILCNSKYLKPQSGFKTIQRIYGKRFLGNGLEANVHHENWSKRRRIVDPAFHQNMVATYAQTFNEVADMLVEEVRKHADTGKPISMLQMLNLGTIDAIARAAYNEKLLNSYELDDIAFVSAIFNGFYAVYREHTEPFHKYLPWNWKHVNHTRNQIDFLRGTILEIIEKRLALMKSNPEKVPKDALDVIIRGFIGVYSMEDIIDDVLAIFVAGQEAAANSLAFMMLELSRHPDLQDRMLEEMQEFERKALVSGDIEDGSKCIPGGNNDLEFTLANVKETLRLYPIVEETYRCTPPDDKDTMLDSYRIPPDTTISIVFFPMHYILFEKGFEYIPDRFMPDTPESKANPDLSYCYLPFSLGQRACLGRPFAYLLSKIILYRLYREFRFEADPTQSYECLSGLTIRPVGGAMFSVYTK